MSDQMPDEVWLNTYDAGPDNGPAKMQTDVYTPESVILPGSAVRYIRADLMEETTKCYTASARGLQRQLVEQQQRAEKAEAERDRLRGEACSALNAFSRERDKAHAMQSDMDVLRGERDRLRAALDRIVEPRAWATPGYLRHIAQEALDHD